MRARCEYKLARVPSKWKSGALSESDGTWRAFYVEKADPKRIIKWETSEGEKAELLGSDRLKYWEMNKEGGEAALERLGISRATPPRLTR